MTSVDIISDLHIEYWDTNIPNKYQHSIVKHKPFKLVPTQDADILVVAGDISDDLDLSMQYLQTLSEDYPQYKRILFVDGNHEHTPQLPNLVDPEHIRVQASKIDRIIYTHRKSLVIGKTVFIGINGWWSYSKTYNRELHSKYFEGWIPHLTEKDANYFSHKVHVQSIVDCVRLKALLSKYESNPDIDNIVVITHTVPCRECTQDKYADTQYNEFMEYIVVKEEFKKLSHWIFGHTHTRMKKKAHGITYLSNPRGIPRDVDSDDEYRALNLVVS